jgi:cell pole-organizing protein PopZ
MEDILASIRRIIADDQHGAGKSVAPAGGARRSDAPDVERSVARARTPYDDVLDLARLVPSADRGAPPTAQAAPIQKDGEVALYGSEAHQDGNAGGTSGLRARLPEPAARAQAQDEDHDMLDHPVPALGDEGEGDLLSPPLGDSVMSVFETLAATVVLQNTPMLERVMRDLLRPMLKTWLDDNLPKLVERLVRTEIERVARGSRG